jgi:putative transposase
MNLRASPTSPVFIRMDTGPEMTSNAIRDWCATSGTQTSFIEPGSPWQNPFTSLLEARVVTNDWREGYNTIRPHSSLGWRPPAAFAAACRRGLTTL